MYPAFQKYLREYKPPVLAIWGKNDIIFIPPGAEVFKTVLPEAKVHFVDGGHFPLENHLEEISRGVLVFLGRNRV
jgi:pimeloyl-ACP methyl ester carboxylesterase